jgi:hypothetical protein
VAQLRLRKSELKKTAERYDHDQVQQHRLNKPLPRQLRGHKNIRPKPCRQ